MTKPAEFGSISTGTLRTEDLLDAFASELAHQLRRQPRSFKRRALRKLVNEANRIDPDSDDAMEIVSELQDALDQFAPPYGYFGAHPGDGADFGYWLTESMVDDWRADGNEIVNDTSELPAGYRGEFLLISDHGNVSLMVAMSRGKIREIWGIV